MFSYQKVQKRPLRHDGDPTQRRMVSVIFFISGILIVFEDTGEMNILENKAKLSQFPEEEQLSDILLQKSPTRRNTTPKNLEKWRYHQVTMLF